MTETDLDAMASILEASGRFRVQRRIERREQFHGDDGTAKKIGVIVDVETTGLDLIKDEIIELGMVLFEFSSDGRIFRILDVVEAFQEPTIPILPEITQLTGITAEMVAGQSIDVAEIERLIAPVALVIAHNAGFDRRFLERQIPGFAKKAWACSIAEIDWAAEGIGGTKLFYLLAQYGLFHDGHRAGADCLALLEILARPLPITGRLGLEQLLVNARCPTVRIWAEYAPFDYKDDLKRRGYKWNDGSDGTPKAWWIDVQEDALAAELTYLRDEIYRRDIALPMQRMTAFERYSARGGEVVRA